MVMGKSTMKVTDVSCSMGIMGCGPICNSSSLRERALVSDCKMK